MTMATKFGMLALYTEEFPSIKPQNLLILHGLTKSSDKLNTLHIYFHKTSDHLNLARWRVTVTGFHR